jgi:hypothetical protein
MKTPVKVLLLHFPSESRDAKAARIAKSGVQLIVEEPRWPRFYEVVRREKPRAIVIDFSRAPSHALETTDYLSKAKDSRDLELYAIHVFDERRDLLKERVAKVHIMSERELAAHLAERLHVWEKEIAAAEEAARQEKLHKAEERRAVAAASRARARKARAAASPAPKAGVKKPVRPAAKPKAKAKAPARKARPPKKSVRRPARKARPAARPRKPKGRRPVPKKPVKKK